MQRSTTALAAALSLLPLGQPLLLSTIGIAITKAAVILPAPAAIAQDASAVAKVAKEITVRIEGATQGSGVIVKKAGNSYTVLTAWHVVSGNRPGEEIGIYTSDGKQHRLNQGSIQRLGQVDMAVLTFSSPGAYEVASVGDVKSVSSGNPIFVSGFPLASSSVTTSIWRFLKGDVIANANVAIPDGYQLLYSNQTLPGMSGGSVLNSQGQLIGIHGRSERDKQVSISSGKAVSTGTNQAVPITYYRQFNTGQIVTALTTEATSADDYLAMARVLWLAEGKENEVIKLSTQALEIQHSSEAFFYRGFAKRELGYHKDAIEDLSKAVTIKPKYKYYVLRGMAKKDIKDFQAAIKDFTKALSIKPTTDIYLIRGMTKIDLKNYQGAIADFSKAISDNPEDGDSYLLRGITKNFIGDDKEACLDLKKAILLGGKESKKFFSELCQSNSIASVNSKQIQTATPEITISRIMQRGLARFQKSDYEGAIIDFSKVISIEPTNDAYFFRGMAKGFKTNYQGAVNDLSQAILIHPKYDYYLMRGTFKMDLKDYRNTIADFNQAITIKPHQDAYLLRGRARIKLKIYTEAIIDFSRAIQLHPEHAEAFFHRGYSKIMLRNRNGGCSDLRKAYSKGSKKSIKLIELACK